MFQTFFAFPSMYLCDISLVTLFSCVWNLLHIVQFITKQRDSTHHSRMWTFQVLPRPITKCAIRFEEIWRLDSIGNSFRNTCQEYAPQVVQLITLQFMRNYFTNAIWYVVHCLPICLNAAGYLANIHTRGCNTRSKHCSMLHWFKCIKQPIQCTHAWHFYMQHRINNI